MEVAGDALTRSIGRQNTVLGSVERAGMLSRARAASLGEGARAYLEAARALSLGEWAVLLRHVVPNVLQTVLLQCVIVFPLALQIFAALGFLGLGMPPPTPDWGASLQESRNYLTAAPSLAIFPGLALLEAALAPLLLGRGLQARA